MKYYQENLSVHFPLHKEVTEKSLLINNGDVDRLYKKKGHVYYIWLTLSASHLDDMKVHPHLEVSSPISLKSIFNWNKYSRRSNYFHNHENMKQEIQNNLLTLFSFYNFIRKSRLKFGLKFFQKLWRT